MKKKWKFKKTKQDPYARPLILTQKEWVDMWWYCIRRLNPNMSDKDIEKFFIED